MEAPAMGDSTQPTAAARSRAASMTRAGHVPRDQTSSGGACRDIVDLATGDIRGYVELLVEQAPKARTRRRYDDDALAEVIRTTGSAIAVAGATGAPPTVDDERRLRVLGARCAAARFTVDELTDEVRLCAARVTSALMRRSDDVTELYGSGAVTAARTALRSAADGAVHQLQNALISGYAPALVWREPPADKVTRLGIALDGATAGDTDVLDGSPALDHLQAVAVLWADGRDAARRLQIAAHDAAVLMPSAIDVGMRDRPLYHRRVVFAGWSRETWRDASAILAAIAEHYNVLVRTTVPAPGLRRLGAAYGVLVEGLPRNAARAARPGRTTTAAATA
jgi:hypothetical protein